MTSSPEEAVLGVMVVMLVVAMFIPFAGEGWPHRAKQIARRSWNYITTVLWVVAAVACFLVGFLAVVVWKPRSVLLLADLVRFLASEWDESSFPSTPASQTPTHADPRGLAKQLFRAALRDFMVNLERYGVREVFLEWIRADRPIDGTCDVYLVTPSGVIIAFGTYTGDERDGWIEIHYCPDEQGNTRWPTPQPHPTKESP